MRAEFFVCFVFLFISTTRGAIHASQIERLERTRIEPAVESIARLRPARTGRKTDLNNNCKVR
jgi:hypothetical protein